MNDLYRKLFAAFQIEHREHLERIRAALGALVEMEGDARQRELEEAFRRAHSLKGAARAVDLEIVERLAHRLETLFSRLREEGLALDEPLRATIRRVLDAIEDWVASPDDAGAGESCSTMLRQIEEILGMEPSVPAPVARAPALLAQAQPVETVRVGAAVLDRLLRSTGRLSVEGMRQNEIRQRFEGLLREIESFERHIGRARRKATGLLRESSPDLQATQVAETFETIEVQMHGLSRRARSALRLQKTSAWGLRVLADELQEEVRAARMVPAQTILEGFQKMVRDLARDHDKEIAFALEGLEVHADRAVLQALKDPLMHLLRNAVSHGIEDARQRTANGKPTQGSIELKVKAVSDRLHVLVADDGRGIDSENLRTEAIRRGVVSEADAHDRSSDDLIDLIFRPGFSTASRVTDIAGRGFGLSVVAETLSRLQGDVKARSRDGGGTTFELSVPLTVSSQKILLVDSRGQTFAIPTQGVERLYHVRPEQVRTVEGRPSLALDGETLPVLDLAYLLGRDQAMLGSPDAALSVAIVRAGPDRGAVAVNAFLGHLDAVVKHLSPLDRIACVGGGVVLPNGSVCVVLNPQALLDAFRVAAGTPLWSARGDASSTAVDESVPTILVVDDSITTRSLEKSILEAHGYRVQVAVDGVEGMELLRYRRPDLVIADIEMPRLNGFGLLQEMKKDSNLADIPVIIVSSREDPEDQERGLALGADAYVVKRKFDQTELLETIRQAL